MTAMTYDAVYTDDDALESFWRSLDRKQLFAIRVSRLDLLMALHQLETLGACGLSVSMLDGFHWLIQAYKGKQGPCYDTGRLASLKIPACAALDDDTHIILGSVPICEKTAEIYKLSQYEKFLDVSSGDAALLETYITAPKEFNCDNFESLAAELRGIQKETPGAADRHVMYAGPFKCLIAKDGSMLWRGQATQVSSSVYRELEQAGVLLFAPDKGDAIQTVSYYDQQFDRMGASCLLQGATVPLLLQTNTMEPRLSTLSACSESFKQRLLRYINGSSPVMIITGSDPGDPLGCCPSEEVSQANALVEAGILDVHRQDAGGDACPVGIYTCAHELLSTDPVETVPNAPLRKELNKYLRHKYEIPFKAFQWLCVVFVCMSIVWGLMDQSDLVSNEASLEEVVNIPIENAHVLLLLREQRRCDFCLNIQKKAEAYVASLNDKAVLFVDRDLSEARYRPLAQELEIFASTLVLLVYKDGKVVSSRVIEEAWSTHDNTEKFNAAIDSMRKAISVP